MGRPSWPVIGRPNPGKRRVTGRESMTGPWCSQLDIGTPPGLRLPGFGRPMTATKAPLSAHLRGCSASRRLKKACIVIRFVQRLGMANCHQKSGTVVPGGYLLNHREVALEAATLSG